jgi:alkanesulfonate monooxygenase SsuD/methylene tetrahydromethanopterin reductase-like flavin-dependent oxidoreductase (luciferase family)
VARSHRHGARARRSANQTAGEALTHRIGTNGLSGDRLILGLGVGAQANEHHAYGIRLPTVPERLDRLAEACAVIRGLTRDRSACIRAATTRWSMPAASRHRSSRRCPSWSAAEASAARCRSRLATRTPGTPRQAVESSPVPRSALRR